MKTLDKYLTSAMNGVIVISLALMVIMVFSNVVLRYVFNSGITASEELSRFCFLWLIFVGSVLALKEGGHLSGHPSAPGEMICWSRKLSKSSG